MTEDRQGFEGWALLEIMGHRVVAGYVDEWTLAGAGMLRVAIPDGERTVAQFYPPSSIFAMTPIGEAEARQIAGRNKIAPIDAWTISQAVRSQIEAEERERIAALHKRRGECEMCGSELPAPDGQDEEGDMPPVEMYVGGGYADDDGYDDDR